VIIPCHRAVGSDRHLTGYGGGLEAKRWLLAHESSLALENGVALDDGPALKDRTALEHRRRR